MSEPQQNEIRVTTKQYEYINFGHFGTPEEAIEEYNRLVALVQEKTSQVISNIRKHFEKVTTFTGEEILYDKASHTYTDLKGNILLGGSSYKKSLETPFDSDRIAPATAKKYGLNTETIKDMWARNNMMSQHLGTSFHLALEQYFKHRDNGTEREYHLPKHPFLREGVLTFPYITAGEVYPEIFVSDVKKRRVGQIDLLVMTGKKKCKIIDYKTDGDITKNDGKNIAGHFNQLSYYAHILMAFGYEVEGLELWNYTDKWTRYPSKVLPLVEK